MGLLSELGTAPRYVVRNGQNTGRGLQLGTVTLSSTTWSSVLFEKLIVHHLFKLHFMVSEISSPYSQQPATRPSPEPDESIPRSHPNS